MADDCAILETLVGFRNDIAYVAQDVRLLRDEAGAEDELARVILPRLLISLENACGCVALSEARLAVPLATVARSMFELLIGAYWATLSDSNARVAIDAEKNESARLMRNNLRSGRAVVS